MKQTELRRLLSISLRTEEGRRRLAMWCLFGEEEDTAYVFFFDRRYRCVKTVCVYDGGIRMADSYSQRIARTAEECGAMYFAAAHNHVNEPLSPSPDDIRLTYTLIQCGEECFGRPSAFLGHYITDGLEAVKIEL